MFAPPKLEDLPAGTQLIAGMGVSTIVADIDFETYSPAGFVFNEETKKFEKPHGASDKGLSGVGIARYSQHPDAEVLCLAYNLKNGKGAKLWKPGEPLPNDLFLHIALGGIIEAWNVAFEKWIWDEVCIVKYGFPQLSIAQLRCAAAKSRAHGLPSALAKAGIVLNTNAQKDKDGLRLLTKFSIPRNPTASDERKRILPAHDPVDAQLLYNYCLQDIATEAEISSVTPDLSDFELKVWQCDLEINKRGVQIDVHAIQNAIKIVEQAHVKYNRRLYEITEGRVKAASEIARLVIWIKDQGVNVKSLAQEQVDGLLKNDIPANVKEALQIRQLIGSAAVKKLYSMLNQVSKQGRLHDLFVYHSARTGRAAGTGPQPQNLPNSGPVVNVCSHCNKHYADTINTCPWCACSLAAEKKEWNADAVEDALEIINTGALPCVEMFFDDAIAAVSGCLRGMFIAAPGKTLICSDYSAIEAVVLACLAGEQWRIDVFKTHGKIYEMSASKICGIPFEEFERHKKETGQHHPMRSKIGKVAELASGFSGWIGAWKNFKADKYFSDEEIKNAILAWRDASPAIVEFWGGQQKNWQPCLYGLEGAAVSAIENPGVEFSCRGITYIVRQDVLYCRLLSGRYITYHKPRLTPSDRRQGTYSISFEGWNTNPANGGIGWIRMYTYAGKLTENVVQATARDILVHAIVNLEAAGFPIVMHVHDEIVAEIDETLATKETLGRFEDIMSTMPPWAEGWPVRAKGGWIGKRYRK